MAWARSVRDQATKAGVSFFFKQWGQFAQVAQSEQLVRLKTKNERVLDGRKWDEIPTPMPRDLRERIRMPLPALAAPTVYPRLMDEDED